MIRFGAVELDDEIVYINSQCQLKINSGECTRGELSMTNRFVYILYFFHAFTMLFFLARSVSSKRALRMDS